MRNNHRRHEEGSQAASSFKDGSDEGIPESVGSTLSAGAGPSGSSSSSSTSTEGSPKEAPLSKEEINLIRKHLRNPLSLRMNTQPPSWAESFSVPKQHPVFDGTGLENFIAEMELCHGRWVLGDKADKNQPEFISGLTEYFKVGTTARKWFQLYARGRGREGLPLSWSHLTMTMRKEFGALDKPDILFERFWDLSQGSNSVQVYITERRGAELLAQDNLLPNIILWAFIRGLKPSIRVYVKLQQPETLEKAQDAALAFEESNFDVRSSRVAAPSNVRPKVDLIKESTKRKREDNPVTPKTPKFTAEQQRAFEKLKRLKDGRCFSCGDVNHRKDSCNAAESIRDEHQKEIARLKAIVYPKK
jgi:Retrotransposon gag protein